AEACVAAPGSTDPGVSDTEIRLGNVSTITGPIPGFGESGRAGAKAYLEYVNSQGGVCGRQLVMVNGDDRLDPSANRSETEKLAGQVFGFVGNLAPTDDGGASVIGGTNIPNCSLAIGDLAIRQPNYFSPNPLDPSGITNGTVAIWQHFKNTYGITKVGVVYANNPNITGRIQAFVNDIQAAGLAVSGPHKVEVTETSYTGVATQMKNEGADAVTIVHEVNAIAKLAQAIRQVQWTPKVPYYGAQTYGRQFIELAGEAAEGALIAVTHDIVENQANPAMVAMAEWYARTNPGESPDFFSILGWTAAELCVRAIAAAGPAPTRDATIAALQGINGWDAGGVLAPRDPAARRPPAGFAVITVQGGEWRRVYPESGFATS
ncbi:MAG: ABC transporter substrate-binding protein, partial [Acidimicrobiales bacterium]